jgi:hypothetical protein
MARSMSVFRKYFLVASAGLFLAAQGAAQTSAPQDTPQSKADAKPKSSRDPKTEEWTPANLPANALAYGAALEQNAPPNLKKWCENYAHKEMPKQKIDPRATMAVVDKEFAKASDEARDAAIFLLDYLAYKHEDTEQRMLAQRIRQIDDQAYDITRRMILLKENQERGMSSISKSQSAAAPQGQADEDIRKMEQQLREMAQDRKMKIGQLETLRKRVDGYLKVMGVTYPRMNGVEPAVLRTMQ